MSFDAIIILANLMDSVGNLNDESLARVNLAVTKYRNHEAPFIVTCGWNYRNDSSICIAHALRDYAVSLGVPFASIVAETRSRETVGHALLVKLYHSIPRKWKRLMIVTSDYHVKRTMEIFSFIFGSDFTLEVAGAPTDHSIDHSGAEARSIQAFHSTFEGIFSGDDQAIVKRLCEKHPFYNGEVYPKLVIDKHSEGK